MTSPRGDEEAAAEVAVAEEKKESGEEHGKRKDGEQRSGEPSPDRERKAVPGHALAAEADDGGEHVDGADRAADGEERDAGEPEVHAEGLRRGLRGEGARGG